MGLIIAFQHNSTLAKKEPGWGSVDKTKLPEAAFARKGAQKSDWGFPHHWVQNGGGENSDGVYTTGTMYLHRGGLNAAWAAAQGARSGNKAEPGVVAHLRRHFSAIGDPHTAARILGSWTDLDRLDQELLDTGLLKPEHLVTNMEAKIQLALGNYEYLICDCDHWE